MKLPQLSLRDLFWLVLVVALLCGFYVWGRMVRSHYEHSFWQMADVMKTQDGWRKEAAQMRLFLEAEGYKVNWKERGVVEIIRPDGTSSSAIPSTDRPETD